MHITLTPEQQKWLETLASRGGFASAEDAARQIIDERMLLETDDLAWAKPYVDKALEDVAQGKVISLDEHKARIKNLLDSFKS